MNQKHVDQVSLRIRMGLSIQRESAWEKRVLNPKCLKNKPKLLWQFPHPRSTRVINIGVCRYSAGSRGALAALPPRLITMVYGVSREEGLRGWGLRLACVPTHPGFVFVWFFIWEQISTTTPLPIVLFPSLKPSGRIYCVWQRTMSFLCVTDLGSHPGPPFSPEGCSARLWFAFHCGTLNPASCCLNQQNGES